MILPNSSRSNYRKPGTLGTVDYYYRLLNQKLGEYILPIAGAVFLLLTIFSTYHLPIPSLNLTHSELYYIWIGALVSLLITVLIASVKYIKPYTHHRKIWIALSTVIAFTLVIGLFHVFGIVPLLSEVEPIYFFSPGQTFTCPTNAQYYGTSGCDVVVGYANGFSSINEVLSPGNSYTCPTSIGPTSSGQYFTDISCSSQYGLVTTPSVQTVQTTFTETGLPNQGQDWYVTYDGGRQGASIGQPIVFTTPIGSYAFSVGPIYPSGYTANPLTGVVSAGSSQLITFSSTISTASSSSSISGSLTTDSVTKIFTEVEASIVGFFYV